MLSDRVAAVQGAAGRGGEADEARPCGAPRATRANRCMKAQLRDPRRGAPILARQFVDLGARLCLAGDEWPARHKKVAPGRREPGARRPGRASTQARAAIEAHGPATEASQGVLGLFITPRVAARPPCHDAARRGAASRAPRPAAFALVQNVAK